ARPLRARTRLPPALARAHHHRLLQEPLRRHARAAVRSHPRRLRRLPVARVRGARMGHELNPRRPMPVRPGPSEPSRTRPRLILAVALALACNTPRPVDTPATLAPAATPSTAPETSPGRERPPAHLAAALWQEA